MRVLAKTPTDRLPTAESFIQALTARGQHVRARADGDRAGSASNLCEAAEPGECRSGPRFARW
jgi:hypothetical protein